MTRPHQRAARFGAIAVAATAALSASGVAAEPLRTPLIAQACAGCHGQEGAGAGDIPAIAGQSREALARTMLEFRSGQRQGTIMGRISRGYSDAEIAALAEYFSQR